METEMCQAVDRCGDDALCAELWRLGVHFLNCANDDPRSLAPLDLLCGLAQSQNARVQLAIIPLLLARPEYAEALPRCAAALSGQARVRLVCYAHAAAVLQREHAERLTQLRRLPQWLPSPFAAELGLAVSGSQEDQLRALAQRQGALGGEDINWLATYEQAAARMLARWEWEAQCAA
jgi:hypothetical protein